MKKFSTRIAIAIVIALFPLWLLGCGDAGGAAKTKPPVRLIASTEDTNIESDVCVELVEGTCAFEPDSIDAIFRVMPINPETEDKSEYMDVLLTGYEVKFERRDTGSDVPKTFFENLSLYCPADEETTASVIVVRQDQKDMPPLSYLQDGYEPSTGLSIIHATCTVTFWGKTIAGKEVVSNPLTLSIYFANFADA
jgi:hypothetical protein